MPRKRKVILGTGRAEAFPGDPGPNKYYIGWALGPNGNLTIPDARNNYGWPGDDKVSVIHDYSGYSNTTIMQHSKIQAPINEGFIPSLSFKGGDGTTGYTAPQILSGSGDDAIDASANFIKSLAPWPVWLCYHHEPEDDFTAGAAAAEYRAAYRYIVTRFRLLNVTNVSWQPIYMNPWTFSSGSGRDWREWHADYNGGGTWHSDIMMDMFGADTYNPLPGSYNNSEFDAMWDTLRPKVEGAGVPSGIWSNGYTMPEFGMSYNAQNPSTPDWTVWATVAKNYSIQHNIKAFIYWDNSAEIGRYSFGPTYDPSGNKKAGWDIIVGSSVKWGGI